MSTSQPTTQPLGPVFSVSNQRFNVVILAAGLGTRLRPATDHIPKALVEVGGERAIDHLLKKYQYVAERFVIASGYCADLLENYVRGKYPALETRFSREAVEELAGPGKSTVLALDHCRSQRPTLITFCDYLIGDAFAVDHDGLGLCMAEGDSILGSYKTVGQVDQGVLTDLITNPEEGRRSEQGFTGIAICHDTLQLKAIAYQAAASKGLAQVDYAFDIIRPYIQRVRSVAVPLRQMYEFGTEDTLVETRDLLGDSEPAP